MCSNFGVPRSVLVVFCSKTVEPLASDERSGMALSFGYFGSTLFQLLLVFENFAKHVKFLPEKA